MRVQGRSRKKSTGGKLNPGRKRKRFELGSDPAWTLLGPRRAAVERTRGGGGKVRLLGADTVQVMDPKTGRTTQAKIVTVVSNPANAFFQRRNILTRGAVLQTDRGRVRVTNRPGQEGSVAGVLVEEARAAPTPP
ncbi:MAG: 30S ribosomal protein S8e [Halobacteria archaeon]